METLKAISVGSAVALGSGVMLLMAALFWSWAIEKLIVTFRVKSQIICFILNKADRLAAQRRAAELEARNT